MVKSRSIVATYLSALVVACATIAVSVQSAGAQTAGNLVCDGCVSSKDLKNNGVRSRDIKNGQVKTPDLAKDAVTRDKIAKGAVTASEVADNSLSSMDLSNETGGDFIEVNDNQTLTGTNVLRSIEVAAPTAGIVIVNSGGYCIFSADPSRCSCSITTGTDLELIRVVASGDSTDAHRFANIATTRGFSVPAGTTTFNLVCSETQGEVKVSDANLTAIFVPTRY